MNLKRIFDWFGSTTQKAQPVRSQPLQPLQTIGFNNGVTLYPHSTDRTSIGKGYKKNAWVYMIVSKCAKKFGQVPWYHYKIKTRERKTWEEYLSLTKDGMQEYKAVIEAKRMRTKSIDQVAVDSPLSKLLNKPNRNQSRAMYHEELYGYKLLSGEGNIWFSRLEQKEAPKEMFIMPRSTLGMVKGIDPWDIAKYKLLIGGYEFDNPKENILMWKFPSYDFDPITLSHLRGMAPLDAGLLLLQSSNEGAERLVAMNKNQGVAGVVAREDISEFPTPEQAMLIRQQFNSVVNDKDLAGTIAYLTGKYNFMQFGLDAGQLKLLEQSDVHFKGLCGIFDVPWQLWGNADSYENRKQYKRDLIYDNLAPACYSLRDEYNAKLISEYNLDRERDVIDCDVIALPELAEDKDKQAAFLEKMGGRLTYNEGRELLGWDRSADPNMDKHYVPANLVPLDQLNADMGDNLDEDINRLNEVV